MTKPRRHIPGQIAMLTRRCSERRYFLRPDKYINKVISFEVGKAATNCGQQVYAAMGMSNHVHFGVGDTTGHRSDFMRDAMSGIARARNRDLGREGHFWGSGSYNDTVLLDRNAIERKLLYIWLNPVRAGLVDSVDDWPGFKILPRHWGKKICIEKPDRYYGRRTPDKVEFVPQPPPGYEDMELEEVREHFQQLLWEAEAEIQVRRMKADVAVLGVETVLERKPTASPDTPDETGLFVPRFATKDSELRTVAKQSYRAFCDRYETLRQRWLKGRQGVTFPCGTVALRRQAPIKCEDPPEDEPGLFATG